MLKFLRATKENNYDLHLACLRDMCPFMFSMDHQNYARYLTVYLVSFLNLPVNHLGAETLLRSNGFRDILGSRVPVNMTIEQTINRHAKSRGGIIEFSRNYAAYYQKCLT